MEFAVMTLVYWALMFAITIAILWAVKEVLYILWDTLTPKNKHGIIKR